MIFESLGLALVAAVLVPGVAAQDKEPSRNRQMRPVIPGRQEAATSRRP